ncbi:Hint domain-containing protein [Paracoccus sp. PAR01]|uniref:Hint domain-containing protein n=1 Tax=Paracoccus sp. PAR01 TaxID=2769282 RepID=UPI00177EB39D|nr:Hint domain-containing protein [Paracoccus sp. PAR01]MBD9525219.1 Hint domain-containing protein [Paracoccus sp. PAR01]
MPSVTQLPDSTIDLEVETPILSLGENFVLNDLNTSQSFDLYDVEGGGGSDVTIQPGDEFSTVTAEGTPVVTGTYAGEVTISTAAVDVGTPFLLGATIQLNDITGSLLADESGNAYIVTDDPLDEDHLTATVTVTIAGIPTTITAPISELAAELNLLPGIGTLTDTITDAVQGVLDTAILTIDQDETASTTLAASEIFCFVAGTLIETENGPIAIENLVPGDMVLTKDNGFQAIRWIGRVRIAATSLERNPKLRPIRISAGALGAGTPTVDLLVSPQHRVLVRSKIAMKMFGALEVLVAAKQLIRLDGVDIATDLTEVEYFHMLFDRHEVVISNGAETESLYPGPQALKSVGKAAADEIYALFPELRDLHCVPEPARPIASGRQGRRLADRHGQNARSLVA